MATQAERNLALCKEVFDIQAELAVGIVDQAMFVKAASKLPDFFAPSFALTMGPGLGDAKAVTFREMTQIVHPIFESVKNKKVEHDCSVLNNDKIRALAHFTSVFVDAWGREVPGTDKLYSFEHIVAFNGATGKITEWSQTWDLVDWSHSCAKRDAVNDADIFGRNRQLYYDIMGAWAAGEFDAKFGESSRAELAAKLFADDFTLDPRYPSTYRRDARDVLYDGPDGYLRWCDSFARTFATPDYAVRDTYPGERGEVWAVGHYTPTDVTSNRATPFRVEFIHRVGFDVRGECVFFKMYDGPQAIHLDALGAPTDDAVPPMIPTPPRPTLDVEKDFQKALALFELDRRQWASGAYATRDRDEALAAIAEVWDPECVVDVRYPSRCSTNLNAVLRGHEGVRRWCAVLSGYDFPGFRVCRTARGPDGDVIARLAFNAKVKSTKSAMDERQDCFVRVVASRRTGRLTHCVVHWGPGKVAEDAALVPNASSPGRFFVVVHRPVGEAEASEWWRATAAALKDPAALRESFERQYELGYYNHHFLPEKAGDPNAPVLCLWESAKSVSVDEFRSFIDGADGPFPNGEFVNEVHSVSAGLPGKCVDSAGIYRWNLPATGFIAPADPWHARPMPTATRGSRFWVRHRFKSEDDRAEFWQSAAAFTAADWKEFAIANHAAGYHNPVFAPAAEDDGDVFCVWECVDPTRTVEQFAEYVDGPASRTKLLKHFVNECHACDPNVGIWPDAKFAKPTGGAMLTIKQTPEAAMAAATSRATAA